ncbi:TPA: hypothetical protein ACP3ZL_007246, partial [Pseudomonas aeruginosa]
YCANPRQISRRATAGLSATLEELFLRGASNPAQPGSP